MASIKWPKHVGVIEL